MTEKQRQAAGRRRAGNYLAMDAAERNRLRDEDANILADAYLAWLAAPSSDMAEARAVLEKMTVEPWEPNWPMLNSCNRENREGIAYLRNHAAAWLDEIDRLRAKCEAMDSLTG